MAIDDVLLEDLEETFDISLSLSSNSVLTMISTSPIIMTIKDNEGKQMMKS